MKKNILIYGATGGIGTALCRAFNADGHNIWLMGRNISKLNSLKKELKLKSTQIFQCSDLSDKTELENIKQWIVDNIMTVDVGVHCVGKGFFKNSLEISSEELKEVFNINFYSAFSFSQITRMYRNKDKFDLIFFGSPSVDSPWIKNSAYGSSKAGLEYFCSVLQKEIWNDNGRIWLYKPGNVLTSFFENSPAHMPREKMITPEELAQIVVDNLKYPKKIYLKNLTIHSTI